MSIIIRLQGGLGNQLFQYAFAKGTASKLGVDFILDRNTYSAKDNEKNTYRKYSLDVFNSNIKFAKDTDKMGFVWFRRQKIFETFYKYLRLKRFFLPFYYRERTFAYDENIFKQKDGTYFDGYWQTEKYFSHIRSNLRKEICEDVSLSENAKKYSHEINTRDAISIHVRRGDYVSNPNILKYHGLCSMDYYKNSIDYIKEKITNPHFFIFSDDYDWATQNFLYLGKNCTIIKSLESKDYEDIILMSKCKHNIISNSSFGWWGAWLNSHQEKIVIAPRKWFANAPKADTRDIVPETWIRL